MKFTKDDKETIETIRCYVDALANNVYEIRHREDHQIGLEAGTMLRGNLGHMLFCMNHLKDHVEILNETLKNAGH